MTARRHMASERYFFQVGRCTEKHGLASAPKAARHDRKDIGNTRRVSSISAAKPLFLLVDDDLTSARQLADMCKRSGLVRLRWVGDALQAISVLSGETGAERPDLIIVDLPPDATSSFVRKAGEHALADGVPIGLFEANHQLAEAAGVRTVVLQRPVADSASEASETEIAHCVRTWVREAKRTES